MDKEKEINSKINNLTYRVEQLETQISKLLPISKCSKADDDNFYTTDVLQKFYNGSPFVEPEDLQPNIFTFAGNYLSKDGSIAAKFGACIDKINVSLNQYHNAELAKIIDAYANEERINIIKHLLDHSMSAKELMDALSFKTTGKLYHHLSILENLGIIYKRNEVYHIQGYAIGCSIMMLSSAARLIRRYEENNKK